MNRIGLLEDHERMAQLIRQAMAGVGIEVDIYGRIDHAADGFTRIPYAALVIDRGLPDGDGLDLVRKLRAKGVLAPCLMLTALDALHDRVAGLEAGADDYLPKPFSMEELVARVRALMRRPPQLQSLVPAYLGLQVLPETSCMRNGDDSVSLAPSELQLMLSLVRAGGQPVRRTALEMAAWGVGDAVTPNALDVALHRLRRKLLAIDSTVEIANVRAYGFALQELPNAL
ncbi:response regulator transcription factor [Collimonas sp. OK412]|jgi:DNA-binding response OmpR family regulator|uniref:response regulator transcription factor n=1 Tax=Collimonas sp. (strain OK412) TaxID=1801619 RepID=UPI0008E84CE4|nr:response regulator transcription factor [Collimonas sp. OK412]SFD26459.1 DNA-binding response regulator, OmpR family, contains REC and winged-helix (wHTH) domain [Collimonas sp. OK412]